VIEGNDLWICRGEGEARRGRSEERPVFGPAVPALRSKQREMNMLAKVTLIAAMTILVCTASARADTVDGKPTHDADRHVPASVRGSPSILLEDIGARGPLGSCASGENYARTGSCGAEGRL
jgi:hypothetical protein